MSLPITSFILFFIAFNTSLVAVDHAPIDGTRNDASRKDRALSKIGFDRTDYTHHNTAAEDFKDKYFRDDETKKITLTKTLAFIDKLVREFENNSSKVKETEFLETIDVLKSHSKKAAARAEEAIEESELLSPYDLYLMPKLAAMAEALKNNEDDAVVEGLLDDFIRGYIPYFNPNPFNNIFRTKVNFMGALYRVVKFPKFYRETNKAQANNLHIENREQRREINDLLKEEGIRKKIGDFLTQDEIEKLQERGFDISVLNPGPSALWRRQSEYDRRHMYDADPRYYPPGNVKKTFAHVMLGGANSDKIKLNYVDHEGTKRHVKLKVGDEVNLELASSALMQLLGFNTDKMRYAGDVTFYLKNKTIENFEAEVRQKFGQSYNVRYNYERGRTDDGEEFVTWRDTLYEARPDDERRIAPLDIASWDLQNRREYRGIMLAVAWLGVNDLKSDNLKTMLVKRGDEWVPEHRIHDLGVSLGTTLTLTGRDSILNLPAGYGKVNQFESKIVRKKKGGVQIAWNDFCYQHRQYNAVTYFDLKWMARKIAAIPQREIERAFKKSGMHPDMAHLYAIKIIKRRNNIVRRFHLVDDFGIFPTPKLKNYSPEQFPTIENGQINITAYDGKTRIPTRVRTWGSLVSTLVSGHTIPFAKFTKSLGDKAGQGVGQLKGGGIALSYNWRQSGKDFGPFKENTLKPGITITPMRKVIESRQNLNTIMHTKSGELAYDDEGELKRTNLPYMVEDSITISVELNASNKIDTKWPGKGKIKLSFAEKKIVHRHFAETVKDAWLSPFRIPKIISKGKAHFAANYLQDLENIESAYSYGADFDVLAQTNYVNNGASFGLVGKKFRRKMLYRDQFGQLHYLTDDVGQKGAHASAFLGKIDAKIVSVAALDLSLGINKYSGKIVDTVVGADGSKKLLSHDHELHTKEQAQREKAALKQIMKGNEYPDTMLNFSRKFATKTSERTIALAYVFARNLKRTYGEIDDTFRNGQQRKLFQATVYLGKHLGKKDILPTNEVEDVAVKNGKSRKTIIEVEMRAPEKFVVTANHKVFSRKADREGLMEMIKKLDTRYSSTPDASMGDQFFSDLVLPDQDEQDEYRKIYAEIKTMVDGEYLLERVRALHEDDVKQMVDDFFARQAVDIKYGRYQDEAVDDDVPLKKRQRFNNHISHMSKKRKVLSSFRKLKVLLDGDLTNEDSWRSIWLLSNDLVHDLSSRYYGVHLLARFLNHGVDEHDHDKGLLVYGEIRNIGDHITMLERPHGHHANLRNAGKHWGNFVFGNDKIRAVQYFLKYEDPTNQVPIYAPLLISSADILGFLEKGQPPNFSGEGI